MQLWQRHARLNKCMNPLFSTPTRTVGKPFLFFTFLKTLTKHNTTLLSTIFTIRIQDDKNSSVSIHFILIRNEKVEYYIKIKSINLLFENFELKTMLISYVVKLKSHWYLFSPMILLLKTLTFQTIGVWAHVINFF